MSPFIGQVFTPSSWLAALKRIYLNRHVTTLDPKGVQFLNVGDAWQVGDMYGQGQNITIGTDQTSIMPGDKIIASMMCYAPRRPR